MEPRVTRIQRTSELEFSFPTSLSFFSSYLAYYIDQVLRVGGEAYLCRDPDSVVSGLFIYDSSEKCGTIFTRSREVFDYFYHLKPFNSLFAELKTEHENETFDIYSMNLDTRVMDHGFSHEISIAEPADIKAIDRFMRLTHPGINPNWVKVALSDEEKCFTVKLSDEIAGLGWASFANGIGRLHSLFVAPQFRRMGIGRDLFYARLLWLKSLHARSAFSEISQLNSASSRIALNGNMIVSGQVFEYFRKDSEKKQGDGTYVLGAPQNGQA